ncbi:MAG: hypothetical protein RLY58_1643 [Pseudomonadota bacterium]|jgi:DNA-binding HxlR family transcriptional regulator
MKWDDVGNLNCSVARTLSVMGDRWTMLVLRNAFMGIRRFDDFQRQLGVTRHVLADRLKRLVDEKIFNKVPYQPNRFEYRLTEKGHALYPILLALTAWGDAWMDEGRGPPLYYHHKTCGQRMSPVMVCSACGDPVVARDVTPMIGPGFAAASGLG